MFINEKIKPFYDRMEVNQFTFRQNILCHYDIEVVFSMNEDMLKKLYRTKALLGKGEAKYKPMHSDWVIVEDMIQLLRTECKLNIPIKHINRAFGLSKKEVDKEFEKDSLLNYNKLTYVEFLEFLTRIAELYFEGSEMDGLELY